MKAYRVAALIRGKSGTGSWAATRAKMRRKGAHWWLESWARET